MLVDERKRYLLSILAESGRIIAKDVSRDLGVSEDTIRRDLRELAADGMLKRVHGGGVPLARANAPFAQRAGIASPEKVAIGRKAATLIEPGQVVFLDGGSTALQLAHHIPHHLEATVITHSPNVALALMAHPNLVVEIVGGTLLRHSVVTGGAATIAWLNRYRPDLSFVGATGLHPQQGITTGVSEDAEVKRAVIGKSGASVILASSEKFGAVASFEVATWRDVDGLVVCTSALPEARKLFASLGCELIAGDESEK